MKKTLIHSLIIFSLAFFALTSVSFAQSGGTGNQPPGASSSGGTTYNIQIENPLSVGNKLTDIIVAVLNNVVMPIAAVAVVLYIIFAGFKYVSARGNPAKIQSAHQNLLWALVGTGILLGAAGISSVLQNTVNQFLNN